MENSNKITSKKEAYLYLINSNTSQKFKNQMKKEIDDIADYEYIIRIVKDEERKKNLISIVNSLDIPFSSKREYINKINQNRIRNEEALKSLIDLERQKELQQKRIENKRKREEERKNQEKLRKIEERKMKEMEKKKRIQMLIELRKMVEDADLDYTSKSNLLPKINNDKNLTKNQLKKEIEIEKSKTEIRRKERERIIELRKMVEDADLDYISRRNLLPKINNDQSLTKNQLKKEIEIEKSKTKIRRKEEERKIKEIERRKKEKEEEIKKILSYKPKYSEGDGNYYKDLYG